MGNLNSRTVIFKNDINDVIISKNQHTQQAINSLVSLFDSDMIYLYHKNGISSNYNSIDLVKMIITYSNIQYKILYISHNISESVYTFFCTSKSNKLFGRKYIAYLYQIDSIKSNILGYKYKLEFEKNRLETSYVLDPDRFNQDGTCVYGGTGTDSDSDIVLDDYNLDLGDDESLSGSISSSQDGKIINIEKYIKHQVLKKKHLYSNKNHHHRHRKKNKKQETIKDKE